jgi:hypothetical protein
MNTALPVTMGWRLKNDNDSAFFRIQKKIVRRISILHQLEEVKTAPLSGEVLTEELWRKRE